MSKDIVLINPRDYFKTPFHAFEPPFWLGLLAGYFLKEHKQIGIVDADLYDLTVSETVEQTLSYKPQNIIIVVMGNNPSASSSPKMEYTLELLKHLDAKVTGIHPIALSYPNMVKTPFADTPQIPWAMFDLTKYRAHNWHCLHDLQHRSPYAVLYTSLNCPYHCYYCNIHTLYGNHKIRYRPLIDVFQDLTYFAEQGITNIKIWDELFCFDPVRVMAITEYIISRDYKFNIWAYARLDSVTDYMLYRMKRAGINWVAYGFESIKDNKFLSRTEDVIKITKENGINIIANFMFGLPGTTLDDDEKSFEFCLNHLFEYVNFYVAIPYPGSDWYKSLPEKPVICSSFSQFSPSIYAVDQSVVKFRDAAFNRYFSNPVYQSMVEKIFGRRAVTHIRRMLSYKITRK